MSGTTQLPSLLYTLSPSQVNRAAPEAVRQIVRQELTEARVASPAFLVQDMDPVTQTVMVQVAVQERVRTGSGPAEWWDVPPIIMVPVALPRGGGFALTLPLKKGDEGMLVFCDACFDFWWQNGQTNAPPAQNLPPGAQPSGTQRQNEVRRHALHDCGFYPGMCSQPNRLPAWSTSAAQLRSDDGSVTVSLEGSGASGQAVVAANGVTVSVNTASGEVTVADGGTPLALVNDTWYQWWKTNIFPFLQSKGYSGPGIPAGSETTVLKAQ